MAEAAKLFANHSGKPAAVSPATEFEKKPRREYRILTVEKPPDD
jgi:hypothetical protein